MPAMSERSVGRWRRIMDSLGVALVCRVGSATAKHKSAG
jgi:hypothetical protein